MLNVFIEYDHDKERGLVFKPKVTVWLSQMFLTIVHFAGRVGVPVFLCV